MKLTSLALSLPITALVFTSISSLAQAAPVAQAVPNASTKTGNSEIGKCSNREALLSRSRSTSSVTGICTFPTDGYSVKLEPIRGSQPLDLTLRLQRVVTPPSGSVTSVVSEEPVKYVKTPVKGLRRVLIFPDKTSVPISRFHKR